jgi:hypothetical protein
MTTAAEVLPGYVDVNRLAVASFLTRYRQPTLTAYSHDLKAFLVRASSMTLRCCASSVRS